MDCFECTCKTRELDSFIDLGFSLRGRSTEGPRPNSMDDYVLEGGTG